MSLGVLELFVNFIYRLALLEMDMDNWEWIIIFRCFAKGKQKILLFTFAGCG